MINGCSINGHEINGPSDDNATLSAYIREITGIQAALTVQSQFGSLLAELSGFSGSLGWYLTTAEVSRLSGSLNMPIRIRTGIMRAIQIPFHGEVVS